jgi:hypothetical protein
MLWQEADSDRILLEKELADTKSQALTEAIELRKQINFLSGNFTEDTDITEI